MIVLVGKGFLVSKSLLVSNCLLVRKVLLVRICCTILLFSILLLVRNRLLVSRRLVVSNFPLVSKIIVVMESGRRPSAVGRKQRAYWTRAIRPLSASLSTRRPCVSTLARAGLNCILAKFRKKLSNFSKIQQM